ncbi:MAG: preprotein translocase subunit SecY [Candidatus Moraniibacteriota bacterium]
MASWLAQVAKTVDLRKKILFIVWILVLYRVLAIIPLPGVDVTRLQQFFSDNQLLGLLNIFSGGGLANISIVLLGVAPYITASIIMQLLGSMIPYLEQMNKEEGEAGRQKFNMITRWLTVPLAIVQSFALISLLSSQGIFLTSFTGFDKAAVVIAATAGTIFLMWLGELMSEKGIGNGVSILIFAGIVASLPGSMSQLASTYDATQFFTYVMFAALALATIGGVVVITEAQRNIPVTYAKRVRGDGGSVGGATTHLPLRINQAGVIPIIFAVSLILIPGLIANVIMKQAHSQMVIDWATKIYTMFQPTSWVYGILYFILVVAFTYFYTAVVFDPHKIAENLQKQGGYVPGVRPGEPTADYLHRIVNRITLVGAVSLGLIAVLPFIVQQITNIQAVTIGGTSLLIVVSVVLDLSKNVQSQLAMQSYDQF